MLAAIQRYVPALVRLPATLLCLEGIILTMLTQLLFPATDTLHLRSREAGSLKAA